MSFRIRLPTKRIPPIEVEIEVKTEVEIEVKTEEEPTTIENEIIVYDTIEEKWFLVKESELYKYNL